jgi:GDPmannose 4,6-dehydratase
MRHALITGITGQDGSYLAEHLLAHGYEVWGLTHRNVNPQTRESLREVRIISGDILDKESLLSAVERAEPDEVYNLADVSYVPYSWQHAEYTNRVTGLGALHVLEAIKLYSGVTASHTPESGQIRFFQASSAEIFGNRSEPPQNEKSPLRPCTPHGTAKLNSHLTTQGYRQNFGMFAVCGILFNHESPRRAAEFLSRKVTLGVARAKLGDERKLRLGNLSARRDWGFAGDYVRAMHLMLAQDEPEDYVIGTGGAHSVEALVTRAFAMVGLNWRDHVVCDTAFIRPADPEELCADPIKIEQRLGWMPTVGFDELLSMMIEADLELLANKGENEVYHISSLESL